MTFRNEKDFEDALIDMLPTVGWEACILENQDETQLLQNWADILFENNRGIDRLNDFPLTKGEMQQILEQVKELKTPLKLNGFINGGSVQITRDNPEDTLHFGKEISLKIYNRQEIAAGQSRYEIVRQPRFSVKLHEQLCCFCSYTHGTPFEDIMTDDSLLKIAHLLQLNLADVQVIMHKLNNKGVLKYAEKYFSLEDPE